MRGCMNLRALPNSICNLKSLKCLVLISCSKIKKLPTNLGKLEQLGVLNAAWTSVSHVPLSCGSLKYLYYLTLGQLDYIYVGYERRSVEPVSSLDANLCLLETLQAPYQSMQHLDLQIGSLSFLTFLNLSNSDFTTIPFNLSHLSQLKELVLNNCQNLQLIKDLPPSLGQLVACYCPLLENIQDVSVLYSLSLSIYKSLIIEHRCSYSDTLPFNLSHLSQLHSLLLDNCENLRVIQDLPYSSLKDLRIRNCSNLIEIQGMENFVSLRSIEMVGCSALVSNSCRAKLFKAFLQNPNLHGFKMTVSKDMVAEVVVGCSSSNYTLPLFSSKKRILILVTISSCLFRCHCCFKYKTTKELNEYVSHRDPIWNTVLNCIVYDDFIEANKVEEVKVVVEFYSPLKQGAEENFEIETCIVYEEEDEVYFFPVNPNKLIKFHPDDLSSYMSGDVYPGVNITLTISSPTSDSKMETEQQRNRQYEEEEEDEGGSWKLLCGCFGCFF
ncbi:PREDICTED: uncharacterized protein LOC109147788 [Ipomoea nil]|uniref:uncharacterized protein LOC109147788 n=1 Tax=Ipomoea nil TaxID=35883 RepID=UPI000900EB90|nr:PREDICTED: uncharacterized protein LOC109147788 [Ipomoea nil]